MKSFLKYIAVLDKKNKLHYVEFSSGVNVITGKSSTGKSAMIEIFDYCFGNSDYTVPEGIITECAMLYFIILSVEESYLVLARDPDNKKAFIKEEITLLGIQSFNKDYFHADFFILMPDFRIELGRYFGFDIVDTDSDLENRKYRYQKAKSPRPSVRHFTSFLLQHQNLVANKHSLFYRFDEKEKREQTIDQFKIFTSFITQDYFIQKQRLSEVERELKSLENRQKNIRGHRSKTNEYLTDLLKEFIAVTGKSLLDESAEIILRTPANYFEKIQYYKIITDLNSDKHVLEINNLTEQKNFLLARKRKAQLTLNEINSSINYAEQYKLEATKTSTLSETEIHLSECPFCKIKNEELADEANLLEDAILWLNEELKKTPYLLDSFLSDKKAVEQKMAEIDKEHMGVISKISKIEKIITELEKNKSLEEQGLKIKLKIENLLEEKIEANLSDLSNQIEKKINEKKELEKEIRDKYNPESKLKAAENYINTEMKKIGSKLDFEDSYRPVNLKFSLDSFDLWHEKPDNTKVFLRSMGSGANWLYCHLSLFTSLHKYFCSLGKDCLIPPILFLDQPSQVYFPTSIDIDDSFDAKKLKKKEGKEEKADEDLTAVTNFYNQLVRFCKDTVDDTGIKPQIIITDHADNLKLEDGDFETLVNGRRWRKRGFIIKDDVIQ